MNEQIKQKFCQELGEEQVLFEEPMKRHTTFRIGGPAEVFVMPRTIEEIQKTLEICRREKLSYFILGNGSNLLVSDQGYKGVIIQMDRNMEQITVEGTEIRAAAGALLSSIAVAARRASLTGFEFAGGIPGTLGGAVVMNAGAYGGEMKDVSKKPVIWYLGQQFLLRRETWKKSRHSRENSVRSVLQNSRLSFRVQEARSSVRKDTLPVS